MTTNTMRRLAASSAVALAFASTANAAGLLGDPYAVNLYRGSFASALVAATGSNSANTRAGGFMAEFEKALQSPGDKTRIVDYPPRANRELLRITAVVPPKGFEHRSIPVCAEQNNKVLGTWNITAKGEVVPVTGTWATETKTNTACKEFIIAARNEVNAAVLARDAQPQPTAEAGAPAKSAAATPAVAGSRGGD